ncbi:MAG: hypothetical protein WAM82_20055 [Thermoanaerobaculia bacterium]
MDASKLRQIFEKLDQALEHPTELLIRGGAELKRLDPEDFADVTFLVQRFRLTKADLEEAFDRLPGRFQADPVVQDNLRFVIEDLL